MEEFSELKSARLLSIYARLLNGRVLKKALLAQEFGVTARSIQRDLESLRSFLSNEMLPQDVVYDRAASGYRLTHAKPMGLSNSEILAVCKILLESRSMRRDEMLPILDKLVDCCVPEENKRAVQQMIGNEKLHYIEPHHGQPILRGLWELGQAVQQRQVLELDYQRLKGAETVRRTVEPVGILFSEYYFYLAAYLRGVDRKQSFENPEDPYPTIYRIDRIRAASAGKTAVVGLVTSAHFNLLGNKARCALIGNEFGFQNVAQNANANHGNEASFELLLKLNPDSIFVLDRDSAIARPGAKVAADVMNNELVARTKAKAEGHIVYLSAASWYLADGGYTSMNLQFQDIEKALGLTK